MLSTPLDIPTSSPPAAPSARSGSETAVGGPSFGDQLKQARHSGQASASEADHRGKKFTGGSRTDSTVTGSAAKPAGSDDSADADTNDLPADIRGLVQTWLAAEGADAKGEDAVPEDTATSTDGALAAVDTLIAQAAPLVVVQVSTDEAAEKAAPPEGEKPEPGTMHRAATAKDAGAQAGIAPQSGAVALPEGLESLPAAAADGGKEAKEPKQGKPAAHETAALPAIPADTGKKSSPTATSAGEIKSDAAVARQAASTQMSELPSVLENADSSKSSDRDSTENSQGRAMPEIKRDAIASAGAALTSVAVVAPGVAPQQVLVTTVSAAPGFAVKPETMGVSEVASLDKSNRMPTAPGDIPATDSQPNTALRESGESARPTRETNGAQPTETGRANLTDVERVRFVQRVARAMHTAVDRGGEVRLRLSPPELGRLTVDVVVRDGVMSARLEAETPSARSLLIDHLPTLRDRLAEQNVRIDRFDVNLRGGASGSLPDRTPDQSGQQPNQHAWEATRRSAAASADNRPATPTPHQHIHTNDQLNVVV